MKQARKTNTSPKKPIKLVHKDAPTYEVIDYPCDANWHRDSTCIMWIHDSYRLQDGWVVPSFSSSPERLRGYRPMAFEELIVELARLRDGNEARILDFVKKWGLLGYSNLRRHEGPGIWESTSSLSTIEKELGDPLDWITLHAKTVYIVLQLIESMNASREQAHPKILRDTLKGCAERDAQGNYIIRYADVLINMGFELRDDYSPHDDYVYSEVRTLLQYILRRHLSYLSETLDFYQNWLRRSKSAPCLLIAIYSMLADFVTGHTSYKMCEFCGEYFVPRRKDQRYCPNPDDPSKQSLCGSNARQKKYYRKHRLKGES